MDGQVFLKEMCPCLSTHPHSCSHDHLDFSPFACLVSQRVKKSWPCVRVNRVFFTWANWFSFQRSLSGGYCWVYEYVGMYEYEQQILRPLTLFPCYCKILLSMLLGSLVNVWRINTSYVPIHLEMKTYHHENLWIKKPTFETVHCSFGYLWK